MSVFVSGSKRSIEIKGKLKDRIDKYMADDSELILGDINAGDNAVQEYLSVEKYENVRIVFMRELSEFEEWPRNNSGKWPYKEYVKRQHEYDFDPIIQCEMSKACDEALFIWDETDIEQFAGILVFLVEGKDCVIYFPDDNDFRIITSFNEIKEMIPIKDRGEDAVYDGDDLGNIINIERITGDLFLPEDVRNYYSKRFHVGEMKEVPKVELKKRICKSRTPIIEKEVYLKDLLELENLHLDLFNAVEIWSSGERVTELRILIMDMIEHSFWHAYIDVRAATKYLKGADGSNEHIILYVYDRYEDRRGKVVENPMGIYTDISSAELALDYAGVWNSNGGRIEAWERDPTCEPYHHYAHKYDFYANFKDICWFQIMRVSDLIDDCDPFEPVVYVPKNSHYYRWRKRNENSGC